MADGGVQMRAKYCRRVWERFAHTLEKSIFRNKNMCRCPFLLVITCVLQSVTFYYVSDEVPQAKWPYRLWDHFIVFVKNDFEVVFTSQIHALLAKPAFLIVCIIGIILHVQHRRLYIYIYEYIFIYIYTYIYIQIF